MEDTFPRRALEGDADYVVNGTYPEPLRVSGDLLLRVTTPWPTRLLLDSMLPRAQLRAGSDRFDILSARLERHRPLVEVLRG